jgi:hypothetical protein
MVPLMVPLMMQQAVMSQMLLCIMQWWRKLQQQQQLSLRMLLQGAALMLLRAAVVHLTWGLGLAGCGLLLLLPARKLPQHLCRCLSQVWQATAAAAAAVMALCQGRVMREQVPYIPALLRSSSSSSRRIALRQMIWKLQQHQQEKQMQLLQSRRRSRLVKACLM